MRPVPSTLIPWLAMTAMVVDAGEPAVVRAAGPVDDSVFEARCQAAVLGLHDFFQDWFNAEVPDSAESLAAFRDSLAEDFQYVGPAGFLLSKPEMFQGGTWPAHGMWKESGGGKARVENLAFRRLSPETALVTYEYWQEVGDSRRGRQDTALFRLDDGRPQGVAWLHVHETWLPGSSP